jgi:hypothetical protein
VAGLAGSTKGDGLTSSYYPLELQHVRAEPRLRREVAEPREELKTAPPFSLAAIPAQMLAQLSPLLPAATAGVPLPSLIAICLNNVPVGIGNFIHTETRGLAGVEIQGGRIEGKLRFRTWASTPEGVDAATLELQSRLLAAERGLRALGFLEIVAETSTSPEFETTSSAWFRTADYRVSYEYRFETSDAAQSLISRVPVHADRESAGASRETNVVTGGMARWDELGAPRLVVRGRKLVRRFEVLAFVPGAAPSGDVTLTRSFEGVTAPPIEHPTFAAFVAAVSDAAAPERNAQVVFPSLTAFLLEFAEISTPIVLGDWDADGTPDDFRNFELVLPAAVDLKSSVDRFEVRYADGQQPLDQIAIVYLRVR